jgi:GTP cyclohydrolase II
MSLAHDGNGSARPRVHGLLLHLGTSVVPTVHGDFRVDRCQNLFTRNQVLALSQGDLHAPEPLPARVHSSCITSECYGSCDCDCAEQLDGALAHIATAGRGVVFYLMQEGRGAGFTAKVRDRMIVQASGNRLTTFDAYERMGLGRDHRTYEEVAALRALLGIGAPLELLTNNPDKLASLAAEGVPIAGTVALRHAPSPFNLHYLAAKLDSGHALDAEVVVPRAAELPETVTYFEPYALDGAPHLIHVASYLVPIVLRPATGNGGTPHWFWLHAYFDTEATRERVVLAYRQTRDASPLVRLQPEALFDRFPLRAGGMNRRSWNATVRRIARHGAGAVAFAAEDGRTDEATIRLLARHASKRARPLVDAAQAPLELGAMLGRFGVTVDPPVVLSDT